MRKILLFTMIMTLIFTLVGCTAHSEPDKKAVESSSTNSVIDTTQLEELTEKKGNETVEKRTFVEETTQPPTAKIYEEKMSKEPIITSATTDKSENETPIKEISVLEITTNTVSKVITTVEENEGFDISYWISYAQNYAQSIGLTLDETAIECWDNPISANASSKNTVADIESRLNRYKNVDSFTSVWIWAEKISDTQYEIYIGYA